MTKINKTALFAVVVWAFSAVATKAATYAGDLLVGFTAEAGNDFVYDIGPASGLTDGKSWNLSASLGTLNTGTVKWGIIGANQVGATRSAYQTKLTGLPNTVLSAGAWSTINSQIGGIYNLFSSSGEGASVSVAVGNANSWDKHTVIGGSGTWLGTGARSNPNAVGYTNVSFYINVANGSAATLLGKFSFAANGEVTFNTNSVVTPPSTPPVPRIVLITRTNTTSTIYFSTTNNAAFTYTLYYTNNPAGLMAPLSNWTVSATSLPGNGLTNSISDISTDMFRFYRIGVH